MQIGDRFLGDDRGIMIIAEAGVNHNGSAELALRLVKAAHLAGADAIKFQLFRADRLVAPNTRTAAYQKKAGYSDQRTMLQGLELPEEDWIRIRKACDNKGIAFLATPFDMESAAFLHRLGVDLFKVGSGDLTCLPLLHHLATYGKPLLLSTGMATIQEIQATLSCIPLKVKTALLHCTSAYPAPYQDLNLRALAPMRKAFGDCIGYSDHSEGIEVPIAAATMGYRILEKHMTLDRRLSGPDHRASLSPSEFTTMIRAIRHVEAAMGRAVKKPALSERETMKVVRRGLYIKHDLPAGSRLRESDLECLRPQTGLGAERWNAVIGCTLRVTKRKGDTLREQDLKETIRYD
ncbi:N-acetylneuraminate synthase family protein [Desmospora profundinema]|uniref:N-acetylneuraminate synthase/N,N'-diacetyllegionaminate synthase n=1 Tax=Desmospora profundinema TaxID=1571184 RepID=A0ABU1IRS9_9BACL|nr:N-acetylneuraminate synthase family protein [Desmospora profundinema]MDR6227506.1 N-acetylneuraminate synthase/N,N'-diacetyllegionaminate synthase [Desmospora profundinema]